MTSTKPYVFSEIVKYHCNPPDEALGRHPDIFKKYIDFRIEMEKTHYTVGEYMYEKIFKDNNKNYVFTINDFPYYFKDCVHYVLWFKSENIYQSIIKKPIILESIINKMIDEQTGQNKNDYRVGIDFIYFENEISQRTVKNIRHIHVFLRTIHVNMN